MNHFYILRIQREELYQAPDCAIKFFPILHWKTGEPIALFEENPDDALRTAIKRFPNFQGLIAVQDVASYNAIVGRLIAEKLARIKSPQYPRVKPERIQRRDTAIEPRVNAESPERQREPERVEAVSASSFFGLG